MRGRTNRDFADSSQALHREAARSAAIMSSPGNKHYIVRLGNIQIMDQELHHCINIISQTWLIYLEAKAHSFGLARHRLEFLAQINYPYNQENIADYSGHVCDFQSF